MEKKYLFSPGRIGGLETKNRIVMAPMVRNYADRAGQVTSKYLAHFARLARGGVGTMILEASYVSPEGKGFTHQLGIYADEMVDRLRQLAVVAHAQGAAAGVQLHHAGRQTARRITGSVPVGPSAIADPVMGEKPEGLTAAGIRRLVHAYARSAWRAREAGFDFVEIHAAHGYLLHQFLSPFSNARDDAYGGSLENRFRFCREVMEAVRETVGPAFPVTVRLSGEEMVENGLGLEEVLEVASRLEALGADGFHISAGNYASYPQGYMIPPMAMPDGPLVDLAARVKTKVAVPVIAVGKLRSPELAEEVLRSGRADFIGVGRSLLADPDWPEKIRQGREQEINRCIACNQGCISRLFAQKEVWCTVNPACSREELFSRPLPARKKKVLVAGGGPGGMQAAVTAARQGDRVMLCEQEPHLGGQLIAAAAAPYRPGWAELREFLVSELERLGVEIRLQTKVTRELVTQEKPDLAILALGASARRPDIPGISLPQVVTARDLLEGRARARGVVAVAGGGCAGAQTAEFLADLGHPVTIVEMLEEIAVDAPQAERFLLLNRLAAKQVEMRPRTRIVAIRERAILVEQEGEEREIEAETVVLCLGSEPNNGLAAELREITSTAVIGDAVEPRKVTEAIIEGALAALSGGFSLTASAGEPQQEQPASFRK